MTYKHQNETRSKSNELISKLNRNGITASIKENGFRDYLAMLEVENTGTLNLYYKPTKNSYSLNTNKISDEILREKIEKIWNGNIIASKKTAYKNKGYEIDIDGSYTEGKTSYAIVVRKEGEKVYEENGIVPEIEVYGSHQVAGELTGAMQAAEYCINNNIKEVTIYYDMAGIEKWATGKWKTNKKITKNFKEFFMGLDLKIKWVKLPSHSGYLWNEYVDKLAKSVF